MEKQKEIINKALEISGLTGRALAKKLQINQKTLLRWGQGDFMAEAPALAWMQKLIRFYEKNPPPLPATSGVGKGRRAKKN